MRFQCALPGICNDTTGEPYTVEAVDLAEGTRKMKEHWWVDHEFDAEPHLKDIVARMEPNW